MRRAKSTPIMAWLRERTFQDVYGHEKMVDGHRETRPSLPIAYYIERRNRLRYFGNPTHYRYQGGFKVANYKYQDHFDGTATYYYFGTSSAPSTLAMID